ncbi:hypothetical protein KKD03_01850 [Patescibacteria group bacterium]|nr:hypothetical protein [Patescibacteria group bacterium]
MIKKYWPLIVLIIYFALFYFNFISFVTADLGRHIVNGREILIKVVEANTKTRIDVNWVQRFSEMQVLTRNYYSYSQPDFAFPNHHWLFGVIVYLIEHSFGFSGLTLMNLSFYTGAFIFALLLAKKKAGIKFTVIAGLIAIPLITARTEVRPESLSLLMFSGFLFCFDLIKEYFDQKRKSNQNTKLSKKIFLPVITALLLINQIVWTNSHLFFIFGPFISGMFLIDTLLKNILAKKKGKLIDNAIFSNQIMFFFLLTLSLFTVTIINPHGIDGSLNPFHIFDNYGYKVAENQSTWFMIDIKNQIAKHSYFIIVAIVGLASFLGTSRTEKTTGKIRKFFLDNFLSLTWLLTFGIMTQFINRISSFYGIVLIPILAQNLSLIYTNHHLKLNKLFNNTVFIMFSSPIVIGVIILMISSKLMIPKINNFGLGLTPEMNNSADFFTKAKLSGPIFNNYDLGGYLVYYLFPEQKVFVDNRPESYSEDFFKNEYIAAQENEEAWKTVSEKYNFETIYYFRLDQTDWAQSFLYRRVVDPNWTPVYVDSYILIFVKNNERNKDIIKKYELPKEIFSLTELK